MDEGYSGASSAAGKVIWSVNTFHRPHPGLSQCFVEWVDVAGWTKLSDLPHCPSLECCLMWLPVAGDCRNFPACPTSTPHNPLSGRNSPPATVRKVLPSAPQACTKKPERHMAFRLWYVLCEEDYSHSIVALGFGDIS